MLCVADVLKMDLFADAHVVAGHRGLHNAVLWAHNAGVPDAPVWLNGGELVMTTMLNLPQDEAQQVDYMRQMDARGVAGLCITVGKYIDAIPPHLRAIADVLGFPLIEIPYTARFVDIAKAINGRISQESLDMVQRALTINQELTQIVLEGGGLQELAQSLARLVRHSISIESATFDAIATVNIASVDEARRYTQIHGRTDARLVEALEHGGYLPRIRDTLRPAHLPVMADVGLEMERLLAPVVVHGMVYGFMWIIADDHALSEIDLMAIESGATIAALMLLYQESAQTAEASLKGSLLTQLIQGEGNRETIVVDQSLRYGVDVRLPYVIMVVDADSAALMPLYRQLNQLASTKGWNVVVGQFAGQIVVLIQADSQLETVVVGITDRLSSTRTRSTNPVRCALSGVQQGAHAARRAHQHALAALTICHRLTPELLLARFDALGYLYTLYQAGSDALRDNPYVPVMQQLYAQSAELFQTLEVYCDAGGNGVVTADTLHIHRSTLNYRLTRIQQVCHVDLQDAPLRLNLHLAIKLIRLFA